MYIKQEKSASIIFCNKTSLLKLKCPNTKQFHVPINVYPAKKLILKQNKEKLFSNFIPNQTNFITNFQHEIHFKTYINFIIIILQLPHLFFVSAVNLKT